MGSTFGSPHMGEADYNHPDSDESLKNLIKRGSVTQVIIGKDKSLYVYAPMDGPMSQAARHRMHDRIVEAYREVYPSIKIFVGFIPLEFDEIEDKAAFKGRLDGTVL